MWEAGKEVSWLGNLYKELRLIQKDPTLIYCDNQSTTAIAKNPLFHKRTKHIDGWFHWFREKVDAGRFIAEDIHTNDQTANVLTKALPCPKHERHTKEMGILPI
jgi:hypothetical protein